mmetsp:Transcript_9255/g.20065  ORF Transcript_9255/g.20065 Transcript_9255/m.20065 type:complete len:320 (-) Transcript_9255:94-1053(-)
MRCCIVAVFVAQASTDVSSTRLQDAAQDVTALKRMADHAMVGNDGLNDAKTDVKSLEAMVKHAEQDAAEAHANEVTMSKGMLKLNQELKEAQAQKTTLLKGMTGLEHVVEAGTKTNAYLTKGVTSMRATVEQGEKDKVKLSKGVLAMEREDRFLSKGVLDLKKAIDEDEAEKKELSKGVVDMSAELERERAHNAALQAKLTGDEKEVTGMHALLDRANSAEFASVSFVQVESNSCEAQDAQRRAEVAAKTSALLKGYCEDMCKVVLKHPDCNVCDGFVAPDATPGVNTWDELYTQFDKLKLVGRDMIKEWTGDAGKFGR